MTRRLQTLLKRAGRYLVPCSIRSLYYSVRFRSLVSLRADVQLSPRIRLGAGTDIRPYARIIVGEGEVTIGRGCGINSFTFIAGSDSRLTIGNHVRIGPSVSILANNRRFDDPTRLIVEQEQISLGITIEDDVWVGAGSVILDGVRIGRGTVIGAGSIVTRDIPPMSLAVGNPARVIRKRGERTTHQAGVEAG